METATEDKTSLQIRRIYPQPVAAVYAAWSDPGQMKHWMGPSDDFKAAFGNKVAPALEKAGSAQEKAGEKTRREAVGSHQTLEVG